MTGIEKKMMFLTVVFLTPILYSQNQKPQIAAGLTQAIDLFNATQNNAVSFRPW